MRPTLSASLWPMLLMSIFILPCRSAANAPTLMGSTRISAITSNFPGWNRKQAITIDHNRVEGSTDLVDFPFLVTLAHLNSEVVDGRANSALNGGGDLRFSSDANGEHRLAVEVVEFVTSATPANRKCQVWVGIPSLSATGNTTIYVWYNKPGEVQPIAIDTYGCRAVWGNYYFVSHNGLYDSASGQNLTVMGSPTSGTSWKGNGTTDYSYMSDGGVDLSVNVSVSIWKKITVPTNNFGHAFALGNASGWMTLKSNGSSESIAARTYISSEPANNSRGEGMWIHPTGYQLGWHYFSVSETTVVGTGELLRGDGIATSQAPTTGSSWPTPAQNGLIMMGNIIGENRLLEGELAEFRVSLTAISPEFSDTDYNNMGSPESFAYAGAPTDGEGGVPGSGGAGGDYWTQSDDDIYYSTGNVGIGTSDPGTWKLAVNGKVRAKEVKVETANWPDFVFTKDYELPTLEEMERHIHEKGHLINIPSAEEVKFNGIELGEMDRLLLEKIEELTLHIIQLKKELDSKNQHH